MHGLNASAAIRNKYLISLTRRRSSTAGEIEFYLTLNCHVGIRTLLSIPASGSIRIKLALKESAEEPRGFMRDAGDFIDCLTIEFEIELRFRPTVFPVRKTFELSPPEAPLHHCRASNDDAHARRLPGDPAFLIRRFGKGDHAVCDQTRAAFVLACEDEYSIASRDVLATVHRLLRGECKRLRRRIANLGFDRKRHASHLARLCIHRTRA